MDITKKWDGKTFDAVLASILNHKKRAAYERTKSMIYLKMAGNFLNAPTTAMQTPEIAAKTSVQLRTPISIQCIFSISCIIKTSINTDVTAVKMAVV